MLFGLTNASATFQRLVNHVLEGLIPSKRIVYIDVVLTRGTVRDEHSKYLELGPERIRGAQLKLKPT